MQGSRNILRLIGVVAPQSYSTQDMRSGHAQDMVEQGRTLVEILAAGEWRSSAFHNYIDVNNLETAAVVEAHIVASDDEAPPASDDEALLADLDAALDD